MTPYTVKCPQCMGANIEPRGDIWWCHDCKKQFDIAGVQEPPPPKKRGKQQ